MNLRLDLAYDGTPFHGYARQPDVRTVQGELEDALGRLTGRELSTVVAGRTDAGVHALGQVVNAPDAPDGLDLDSLKDKLNGMLAPAISISAATEASPEFSARFSAKSRCYVYALSDAPIPDPFSARTVWQLKGPVDIEVMNEAAGHLVGEHDFRSFGRLPDPQATPVRRLYGLSCSRDGHLVRIRARANAFIQQMVRSLVGTLVETGAGKIDPGEMPDILASHDRARAGAVAPPHGLCLVAVEYDDGWSHPPGG